MADKPRRAKETYRAAGVDINTANELVRFIGKKARATFRPEVISDLGFFGGLFQLGSYVEPVLVSSTDGVGTKIKVACALGRHETIGIDLVHHCVNDILTCGAEPLFFHDYIAMSKLEPEIVESIVNGMTSALSTVGCALIGGETAEMPGIYSEGGYDLVGFIVGVVEKKGVIDGKAINKGDAIIGLPPSGLHTNGYSLARKIFSTEPQKLNVFYPELGRTIGEELLEPHRCYYPMLKPLLPVIKGIAHITGGGIMGNLPRILPPGLTARIERGSWEIPPIFSLIQREGNVEDEEMYRVFNMGIGMVLVCSPVDATNLTKAMPEARFIGEVIEQKVGERVIIA
ncbi:Phosphoribosylformylglycinamidine cyclo-ligase [subsurface metagenome]